MDYAERSKEQMVKIKSYRIGRSGRGVKITLPSVWVDDLGLVPGEKLDLFRDTEGRLIIVAPKTAAKTGESSSKPEGRA